MGESSKMGPVGFVSGALASLPLLPIAVNLLGWSLFAASSGGSAQGPMMIIFLLSIPAAAIGPIYWLIARVAGASTLGAWAGFLVLTLIVTLGIGLVASL